MLPCPKQHLQWEGLLGSSEVEGLWGGKAVCREEGPPHPIPHPWPGPPPRMGEGQAGPTNGLMIHHWALVCANWLCWLPDSWQGAGLWGTPVSLPRFPPRMAT